MRGSEWGMDGISVGELIGAARDLRKVGGVSDEELQGMVKLISEVMKCDHESDVASMTRSLSASTRQGIVRAMITDGKG